MDIVVGTAGHIDHGKTALVRALTGVDADRLPEEKQRGITIDIGFAELRSGPVHFSFVDVPGHERFVKNMLAGASGIDLVLLVVASDEGVMPQTREHFDICKLLGLKAGLVALTKADIADAETLELARLDVAELVEGSFLHGTPIVPVSSKTGEGVDRLREALEAAAARVPRRPDDLSVQMPVDRSFSVKGFGTVVTGTLSSGRIAVGDELELTPSGRRVRVRGLQSHGSTAETAVPGRRVAVNLGGVGHDEISRGEMLVEPDTLRPASMFDALVEVLPGSQRPIRSRQRVRIHAGTAELFGRLRVLNEPGEIAPGHADFVQVSLESPAAARLGDRFVIRSYSPQATIGGGTVLDPIATKRRRSEFPSARETLGKLAGPDRDKRRVVSAFIDAAGERSGSMDDMIARTGWRRNVLESAAAELAEAGKAVIYGEWLISADAFAAAKARTIAKLEAHHRKDPLSKGVGREALKSRAMPAGVFEAMLAALKEAGKIALHGDVVALAAAKAALSPEEEALRSGILKKLAACGLQVPKTDELIGEAIAGTRFSPAHAKKILFLLLDSGDVLKISEEFVFSRAAIDDLAARLRGYAARGDRTIDVPKFKDIAGVSRKYAIPLLEYFDREKVTLRTGDKRVIR